MIIIEQRVSCWAVWDNKDVVSIHTSLKGAVASANAILADEQNKCAPINKAECDGEYTIYSSPDYYSPTPTHRDCDLLAGHYLAGRSILGR